MIHKLTTTMIRKALAETGRYDYPDGQTAREQDDALNEEAFMNASLANDLGLDSLDVADLASHLESKGFWFDDEELAKCETVGDLIQIAQIR